MWLNPKINKSGLSFDNLKKRGPDNKSFYKKKNITLIHTRLSILDLSPYGNQPIIDKNSGTVLIYNGEIYELDKLKSNYSLDLNSKSDTRHLLNILSSQNIDEINNLQGYQIFPIRSIEE